VLRDLSQEQQIATVASLPIPEDQSLGPFDALFIATRKEQILAAVWSQPQAGRTAVLWPPKFASAADDGLARELVETAVHRTSQFDTALLQATVEPIDTAAANLLSGAGFSHLTNLIYLESLPTACDVDRSLELQFATFNASERERWKHILGLTYIGSLDCPQLDAVRLLDDVLDGYMATGEFDPTMWFLVKSEGQDVGVLLLTPYTKTEQIELIYMGVVREARGRGIGAAVLQQAQETAVKRRAKKLLLAVDSANFPARNLYEQAGFQEWSQRSVFIRAFPNRA
jgi:ribosomal protein S18 acetylase RimI-like enzyme